MKRVTTSASRTKKRRGGRVWGEGNSTRAVTGTVSCGDNESMDRVEDAKVDGGEVEDSAEQQADEEQDRFDAESDWTDVS